MSLQSDHNAPPKTYQFDHNNLPFELEVHVYRRPNLRDDALEMEAYIGRGILDSLFDKQEMRPDVTSIFLSFPERWLNIVEQRQIWDRIAHYCPNVKQVMAKTHSVYIVQVTAAKHIGLVPDIPTNEDQSDITRVQAVTPLGNLINLSGINVL